MERSGTLDFSGCLFFARGTDDELSGCGFPIEINLFVGSRLLRARLRFLRMTRKGKSNIKIKVKGSGQECPHHTSTPLSTTQAAYARILIAGCGWTVRTLRFR